MSETAPAIVHIGLGAFHRAHQAVYLQSYFDRTGDDSWQICAANIRSNRAIVDALHDACHSYPVVAYESEDAATVTDVRVLSSTLFAGGDKSPLLRRLTDPATRLVTLTVTEKGYGLLSSGDALNHDDPAIAADWQSLEAPKSVPGLLLAAIRARAVQGLVPFTVLSCDNLPHNGRRVQAAVRLLAERHCPELVESIQAMSFPSSMVDRIVPAVTDEAVAKSARWVGQENPLVVVTEQFSQWVVEDNFSNGRPDWEADGVTMVDDVEPYETMKLRLLNGAHSLLAYAGLLLGHSTVDQAVNDPALRALVLAYFDEARVTVKVAVDLDDYCAALIKRFANNSLHHQLAQIAMDGSQKVPQRWLRGVIDRRQQGLDSPITALALACWMSHLRGEGVYGASYPINDPLVATLKQCVDDEPSTYVAKLMVVDGLVPSDCSADNVFVAQLVSSLEQVIHCTTTASLTTVLVEATS
jgi:fructuronate reductase